MNLKIYEYFYELRIFIGIAWSDVSNIIQWNRI